jgi:hypothetical protein
VLRVNCLTPTVKSGAGMGRQMRRYNQDIPIKQENLKAANKLRFGVEFIGLQLVGCAKMKEK